jgi:hypothetical protein
MKGRDKLTGGQSLRLFQALLDGRAHDRVATAAMIGCTNKTTLAVLLSTMKKHRIITYDRTTIQLHDDPIARRCLSVWSPPRVMMICS